MQKRNIILIDAAWELQEIERFVDDILPDILEDLPTKANDLEGWSFKYLGFPSYDALKGYTIKAVLNKLLEPTGSVFAIVGMREVQLPYELYRCLDNLPTITSTKIVNSLLRRTWHLDDVIGQYEIVGYDANVDEKFLELKCLT